MSRRSLKNSGGGSHRLGGVGFRIVLLLAAVPFVASCFSHAGVEAGRGGGSGAGGAETGERAERFLALAIDGPDARGLRAERWLAGEMEGVSADSAIVLYQSETGLLPRVHGGRVINGGIPQRAPMQRHLKKFRADVARQVPAGYRGVVVLDYEAWRPIWEWRNSERVRSLSLEHARQTEGPGATEADAARGFERAARSFLERTLRAGREVRPEAIWAYYDFPAYHPGGPSPEEAARELAWMAELVDVAMPNIYPSRRIVNEPTRAWADTSFPERREWLDEKIGFAARFDLPIAPITRIRYHGRNDRYAHEPIGLADAVLTYRETAARVRGWVLWDYIRDEGDARRFREAADEGLGPVFSGLRDRVRLVAPHDVLAPRSAPGSGSGAGGGRGG